MTIGLDQIISVISNGQALQSSFRIWGNYFKRWFFFLQHLPAGPQWLGLRWETLIFWDLKSHEMTSLPWGMIFHQRMVAQLRKKGKFTSFLCEFKTVPCNETKIDFSCQYFAQIPMMCYLSFFNIYTCYHWSSAVISIAWCSELPSAGPGQSLEANAWTVLFSAYKLYWSHCVGH